ncbi:hypothetical protein EMEDMD4_10111 [Sinorhizobium medicae]|uniref:Uncharacterized protein n=1 Tax=Sinorhizobium medicae TaxID=110321 RepID=A0A508WMZ0_9HYPH|nr:hypothetical protein EMEDMD4_10111 [Sinorhizobium medicae]
MPGHKVSGRSGLRRKTLAATSPAGCQDLAPTLGGHTCTEAVTALANKLGRLVGTLHLFNTAVCGPSWVCMTCKSVYAPGMAPPTGGSTGRARLIGINVRPSQFPSAGDMLTVASPRRRTPLKIGCLMDALLTVRILAFTQLRAGRELFPSGASGRLGDRNRT